VYDSNAATFDVTPTLALVNDSVVSYSWSLVQGDATLTNANTATANLTGVSLGTSIELTLVVTTNNGVVQYRVLYATIEGVIYLYREHFISSNATTVTWSVNSNDTSEYDWKIDSSVNGIITNGTAAVNAMSGSFAYVKASPTDKLSFYVKDSIWAQADYSCQPAPVGNKIVSRSVAPAKAVAKDAKQTAKPTKEANKK